MSRQPVWWFPDTSGPKEFPSARGDKRKMDKPPDQKEMVGHAPSWMAGFPGLSRERERDQAPALLASMPLMMAVTTSFTGVGTERSFP